MARVSNFGYHLNQITWDNCDLGLVKADDRFKGHTFNIIDNKDMKYEI